VGGDAPLRRTDISFLPATKKEEEQQQQQQPTSVF